MITAATVNGRSFYFRNGPWEPAPSFHDNGLPARCFLAKDASLPVMKTTMVFMAGTMLYFHENGQVKSGTLHRDATVTLSSGTFTFMAGTILNCYEDGSIFTGFLLKNAGFSAGVNRLIAAGTSSIRQDDIPETSNMIFFSSDGSVKRCSLAEDSSIMNGSSQLQFSRLGALSFHDSGMVHECHLVFYRHYMEVSCGKKKYLLRTGFNDTGKIISQKEVEYFYGKKRTSIGQARRSLKDSNRIVKLNKKNITYIHTRKSKANVTFISRNKKPHLFDSIHHPNGNVCRGFLTWNTEIPVGTGSVICEKGSPVQFDEQGNLTACNIALDTLIPVGINLIEFAAGDHFPDFNFFNLEFYPNGTVSAGNLAKDTIVKLGKDGSSARFVLSSRTSRFDVFCVDVLIYIHDISFSKEGIVIEQDTTYGHL